MQPHNSLVLAKESDPRSYSPGKCIDYAEVSLSLTLNQLLIK